MADSRPASSRALKRLAKELQKLTTSPIPFAECGPVDDDLAQWHARIQGPVDTPYAGGVFVVSLQFPPEYPLKPPEVRFITKVYHPQVDMSDSGRVCAEIIAKTWAPVLKAADVIEAIHGMLRDPTPEGPLDAEIGNVLAQNPKKFASTAKTWTKKYAS